MRFTARVAVALLGGLLGAAQAAAADPEAWPSRTVRIVVSFPAGGPMDILGRLLAVHLAPALGQPVIVENRIGAAGNIGLDFAAKAPPDGHVLALLGATAVTAAIMNPERSVDPLRAFAPVTRLVQQPLLLVSHPGVPARTLAELIQLARREPERLSYSTQGVGTPPHVAGMLLLQRAGLSLQHIPYSGSAQTYRDVISGEVPLTISFVNLLKPFIQGGQLRALAVTTRERSAVLPEVPTVAEAGFPGFDVGSWLGLVAPAGTPREVVARLNTELLRILERPEVRAQLAALGMEPSTTSPEQFAVDMKADFARWEPLLKATGARPE